MSPRLDVLAQPAIAEHVMRVSAAAHLPDTVLPITLQELVTLRASQINGCGFCTDMHVKDALRAGEDPGTAHLVAAWREATCLHRGRTGRAGADGARHPDRRRSRRRTDDVWLNAWQALRRGAVRRTGLRWSRSSTSTTGSNVITRQPAGGYVVGQYAG